MNLRWVLTVLHVSAEHVTVSTSGTGTGTSVPQVPGNGCRSPVIAFSAVLFHKRKE